MRKIATMCLMGVIASVIAGPSAAVAEQVDMAAAAKDFDRHCAVCHGVEGKGDGPMAEELVTSPADLTGIAKRNGGTFPQERVKQIIEYGGGITSHGPSDMLAWGAFFMIYKSGDEAAEKIKSLTEYVKSLQK